MTKAGGEAVEVDGDIFFSDVTVDERDDLEYQVISPPDLKIFSSRLLPKS